MKVIDIALKDLTRFTRSFFAIGMMFVAPLLITGLLYAAFGGAASGKADLPATKVVVVNLDVPPAGGPDMGKMTIDMFNDPSVSKWLSVSQAPDEATAHQSVDRQQAGVAVIIPSDFSASIVSGQGRPQVRMIQDPTLTIGPMVVKNMLGSLIDGASGARIAIQTDQQRRQGLGLPTDPSAQATLLSSYQQWFTDFQRTLYHSPQAAIITQAPSSDASSNGQPVNEMGRILGMALTGQIIFFGFYTGAYSMMSILNEQEEGTLARMFTTPTSRTLVLAGKFLAVVLIVAVQAVVMLIIGGLAFRVNWGQPLSVTMAVAGQVVAATGLGVLIISLVKTSRQAGPVLGGFLSVLGMLGGLFTTAMTNMPKLFDAAGMFTPQGWVLKGWKTALAGGAPADMAATLLVLLAMGLVMFAAGATIFRRRFA